MGGDEAETGRAGMLADERPPEAEPARRPARRAGAERGTPDLLRRVGETCLWLIVIAFTVWGAFQLAAQVGLVALAFLFSLVLAALLTPVSGWLRRHGWRPAPAALVVLVGFLILLGAVGAWIVPSVSQQLGDLEFNLTAGLNEIERWLIDGPLGLSEEQVGAAVDRLEQAVRDNLGSFAQGAVTGASLVLQVLAGLVFALVVLFFLLKDGAAMWRWVTGLAPVRHRDDVAAAGERSWGALTGFIRAQSLVALIDAVGIGLGLVLLSVPLALPLAMLTFFAAYIPYIGAISAGAAAVLVALVTEGPVIALAVLALIVAVQQIEGNILQPLIMGRALHLHPVVVLIGVTAGGLLAGIIGSIVATPLLALASGVFGHVRDRLAEPPPHAAAEP